MLERKNVLIMAILSALSDALDLFNRPSVFL